jgi:hypothetical protein
MRRKVHGSLRKPVWNIVAEQFAVLLVNAQHIKAALGRKTEQEDSEWICRTDCCVGVSRLRGPPENSATSRGIA